MRPTALVVDDEPDICELLAITLNRMDIATRTCGDITSAKQLLNRESVDLCLTDMRLPDGNGLELVEWMQREKPGTPVAVITAHGSVEAAVKAYNGESLPKTIDTGFMWYDATNIDDDEIQAVLYE